MAQLPGRTFGEQLRNSVVNTRRIEQRVFGDAVLEAHSSVVFGSPLTGSSGQPRDTSYLAASWQLGWGGMPAFRGTGEGDDKDPGKTSVQAPPLPQGEVHEAFIATNTVYAQPIEENVGGGTYRNGGPFSVALTIAAWQRIVDASARKFAGRA